jgi:16S rRNA (guanine966-N2)-methyltransferase
MMKKLANSVRIISGQLRRRKISFPASDAIRPTGDRVRETLFNWLQNEVADSYCLDLFAGSGILGLEALSRGAKEAVFIERDRQTAEALQENLTLLNLTQGQVFQANALDWLASGKTRPQFNIVFLDPPFAEELLASSCTALEQSSLLAEGCCFYVESATAISEIEIPQNWVQEKDKKAGNVHFYLFRRKEAN